jgi:hypothetical protein
LLAAALLRQLRDHIYAHAYRLLIVKERRDLLPYRAADQ